MRRMRQKRREERIKEEKRREEKFVSGLGFFSVWFEEARERERGNGEEEKGKGKWAKWWLKASALRLYR